MLSLEEGVCEGMNGRDKGQFVILGYLRNLS